MIKTLVLQGNGIYKNMEFQDVFHLTYWVTEGKSVETLGNVLNYDEAPFTGIRAISDMQTGVRTKNIPGLKGRVVFVNVDYVDGEVSSLTDQQIRDLRLTLAKMFMKGAMNA